MNFQKSKASFLSADGASQIACYFYEPPAEPIGVLQISHGMCEYMERYEEFADFLCGKGFAVCGHDHLGHGASAQNPDGLGYFAKKDGAAFLPEDVRRLTQMAKKRWPGKPYFLLGHSMGPAAGAGKALASLLCAVGLEKHRSIFLNSLAFGSYNRRFDAPKSKYAWLSREDSIVRKYEQDPLCNYTFTAAGFRDLFALLIRVSAPEWAEKVPKNLPVFLISGEDDPVGDYGKGVRKVEAMLRKAGIRDLSCRLYPGGRHEILNETNRREVYEDVWEWLRERLVSMDKR